ncbi:MAG: cache domain-containing protein [Smithellaceae bacterium]|nr:cache domain-containing protein [Smithellaceae bacterium]
MSRWLGVILGGRLQKVLIASFALVAALTIGLDTFFTSRIIREYLSKAEADVVARDMNLAKAFYQLKLEEIEAISHRLSLDAWVINGLPAAARGESDAVRVIDQQIANKISVLALGGTHFIAVLDEKGRTVVGRVLSQTGELSAPFSHGEWKPLPIVQEVLATGKPQAATEVISKELLAQVGLDRQAFLPLIETPLAAPAPFDPREGTAGLTLTGAYPLRNQDQRIIGAVLSVYLFNNDFTLVDRIKEVAGIDTVTIFFGDLRVATNVMTEQGKRAVGTRISQAVGDVVLAEGRDYVGRAYVVNEWFITRYTPLTDSRGRVVGSLYVGARESSFLTLVKDFNNRVGLIALICIMLAGLIAIPLARLFIRPIETLVESNRRLSQGDMSVRVKVAGTGELATLGHSFNAMVETLDRIQKELVYKEKLASMGQLAAGVAHEINNPLGTIMLYSETLYREAGDDVAKREDLKMIIEATHRCKRIVADLLNFARKQEMLTQESDLHEILKQAIQSVSRRPGFDGVRIIQSFEPDLPPIQADPAQLVQVFVNLLNNAADALPEGGVITVATRLSKGRAVEIDIADTGRGIAAENLGKLFTPFFTTKPLGQGTGLGLSIVYGIIKMHRGQINVSSQVGKGTTFTVTLPMIPPKTESPPTEEANASETLIQ